MPSPKLPKRPPDGRCHICGLVVQARGWPIHHASHSDDDAGFRFTPWNGSRRKPPKRQDAPVQWPTFPIERRPFDPDEVRAHHMLTLADVEARLDS